MKKVTSNLFPSDSYDHQTATETQPQTFDKYIIGAIAVIKKIARLRNTIKQLKENAIVRRPLYNAGMAVRQACLAKYMLDTKPATASKADVQNLENIICNSLYKVQSLDRGVDKALLQLERWPWVSYVAPQQTFEKLYRAIFNAYIENDTNFLAGLNAALTTKNLLLNVGALARFRLDVETLVSSIQEAIATGEKLETQHLADVGRSLGDLPAIKCYDWWDIGQPAATVRKLKSNIKITND